MCWNWGVRKRLKLCSMMKTRKKSGLRRAQRMYQGSAVRQKVAMATGCRQRKASRQRLVKTAQRRTAPPERIIAAGPLARVARPRKKPKRKEVKEVEERNEPLEAAAPIDCCVDDGARLRSCAAKTMAMVSIAAKGMSGAAAREKPIMPTVVGRSSRSQRAATAL